MVWVHSEISVLAMVGDGDVYAFEDKTKILRGVVGLTSVLSIIGSLLIILSYVCFKDLRNKAREILVHISIMDFGVALSNLAGVGINFSKYYKDSCNLTELHHHHRRHEEMDRDDLCHVSNTISALCVVQGGFALFFTLGSILWTISLSMYLYLLISQKDNKRAKLFVNFAYAFCYLMPLGLTVWLGAVKKIGYSPYESSGWCGTIFIRSHRKRDILSATIGYNLWIFLTFVLVPVLSISAHMHIKDEVRHALHSSRFLSALQVVDFKFLLIPVVFILLRFWSFFGDMWFVYTNHPRLEPWTLARIFMYLEGIGDSGQGIANGILFVLFTKKARERFICCWRHWRRRKLRETPGEMKSLLDTNRTRERINSRSYMDNTYTPSYSPRTSPSH